VSLGRSDGSFTAGLALAPVDQSTMVVIDPTLGSSSLKSMASSAPI